VSKLPLIAERAKTLEAIAERLSVDPKDEEKVKLLPEGISQLLLLASTPPVVLSVVVSPVTWRVLTVSVSDIPQDADVLTNLANAVEAVVQTLHRNAIQAAKSTAATPAPECPADD
jgi:hypothetical protein